MITTPLLEDKYKVQRQLAEEAQHDIAKYIKNSRTIVHKVEADYGVKFKYGHLPGGKIEPLALQTESA